MRERKTTARSARLALPREQCYARTPARAHAHHAAPAACTAAAAAAASARASLNEQRRATAVRCTHNDCIGTALPAVSREGRLRCVVRACSSNKLLARVYCIGTGPGGQPEAAQPALPRTFATLARNTHLRTLVLSQRAEPARGVRARRATPSSVLPRVPAVIMRRPTQRCAAARAAALRRSVWRERRCARAARAETTGRSAGSGCSGCAAGGMKG